MSQGWPDRFVYAGNATNSALVNALPIAHAGLQRISRVVMRCGAPSDKTDDVRRRREAIDEATVVYCFTGGLQTMSNGAILGAQNRCRMVYVPGAPRVEFIVGADQIAAEGVSEPTLADYLTAYGRREIDPRARDRKQCFYPRCKDQIESFAQALCGRATPAIPDLLAATAPLRNDAANPCPQLDLAKFKKRAAFGPREGNISGKRRASSRDFLA